MKKSAVLVQGIGIKGMTYPAWEEGKHLKEYDLWVDVFKRCKEKYWARQPTYVGVTCSENFKSYTFFYEWCNRQIGFKNRDDKGRHWHLDKDILSKGNKVYSEDVCVFVPMSINMLLTKSGAARGDCPIGVTFHKKQHKFRARCNNGSKVLKNLGSFNTAIEAFQAYKHYKESLIKKIAEDYKHQLDPRVYDALINYEVSEND
jgi:hypothetical protein